MVCRKALQHATNIRLWDGWATAAEDHTTVLSFHVPSLCDLFLSVLSLCRQRTGSWWNRLLRSLKERSLTVPAAPFCYHDNDLLSTHATSSLWGRLGSHTNPHPTQKKAACLSLRHCLLVCLILSLCSSPVCLLPQRVAWPCLLSVSLSLSFHLWIFCLFPEDVIDVTHAALPQLCDSELRGWAMDKQGCLVHRTCRMHTHHISVCRGCL